MEELRMSYASRGAIAQVSGLQRNLQLSFDATSGLPGHITIPRTFSSMQKGCITLLGSSCWSDFSSSGPDDGPAGSRRASSTDGPQGRLSCSSRPAPFRSTSAKLLSCSCRQSDPISCDWDMRCAQQ